MKSIKAKLTVTVIILFVIALGLLAGLNYWQTKKLLVQDAEKELASVVFAAGNEISLWLDGRKIEINSIARSPVMTSGDGTSMQVYLDGEIKNNTIYENIFWTDTQGNYYTRGVAANAANRPYFQEAMKGNTFVSDPLPSGSTGKTVVIISTPIRSNGAISGVLVGAINMEEVEKRILDVKVGQTGYAYALRQDGTIIFHQNKELVNKVNVNNDPNATPELKAAIEKMLSGQQGVTNYNYTGSEKYLAYTPIKGTSWALGVTVPANEVLERLSSFTWSSLVTILVVLILSGCLIRLVAVRIATPLGTLEAVANRIAGGDLKLHQIDVNSQDEVGRLARAFETMVENLRNLVQQIGNSAEQVAASSEELTASSDQAAQASNHIATSITDMAGGTTEQLAAANDASAVVEQMSAGIQQVAASANQVAAQSSQAADKAKDGDKAIDKAVTQMSHIENTVNTSAQVVTKLGERSHEIGQIVDTISGIAGQTNLLALNAAIEAARAGEQGRGFAVVAEEVRKLAEQSQEAAKKIAELIGEIQGDTDKAVLAMNAGTQEVKTGAEVVNAAGNSFREIVELVTNVSGQIKEISAAIQQISTGSQQIVGSVKKIDDLSKKSAAESQSVSAATEEQLASMEEIATSSQALANLAQDLQTAVAKFQI
ncbi:methyl-accepting chemotaxis protein [Sporomusa acidovorans]|uniref:Methyl-accepting chemotaxis protein McpA n=1 Tax=Sporomusa acidovorans (strain ATCC 49682 / DSM 3132 / Mol) TaxID=1123286 RepID=A0ABZ3J632_SPOA4|nr:methyl-accepting chemotaxis protein [Sporomusa acidovorans]OZC15690.1 methyl-accepting chemotaxis protein McpA [Sporomusa acidovorans DSM 3132]SDE88997.1 methyl-accepting chemotaxis protein [Sporomusa acidovorans]